MDFLQHFYRCLNFMRFKEVEANFVSIHSDPVLQTYFESLEVSGANWFTREIFFLFWVALDKSASLRLTGSKDTFNYVSYAVSKYQEAKKVWACGMFLTTHHRVSTNARVEKWNRLDCLVSIYLQCW